MMEAAVHFGHKASKWNPKMREYIFAKRENIHIFDLVKTYQCLSKALDFLRKSAAEGKTILLLSTKLQSTKLVTEAAQKCGCPYVTRSWMPGLLTNFDTIKKRIKYFRDLKTQQAAGEWDDKYTKKEQVKFKKIIAKLEDAFGGVENLTKVPDVLVVFDSLHETLALKEARRLKVKTVGVCDSNADPDLLNFPIPGNDDAIKSLRYFVEKVAGAIEEGKKAVSTEAVHVKPPEAVAKA